jgi:hypothetical protein
MTDEKKIEKNEGSDHRMVGFALYIMYELGDLFKEPGLSSVEIKNKIQDKLKDYKEII